MRPELAAAIEYTALTGEGLLRQASFKGLQQSHCTATGKVSLFELLE